MEDMPYQIAIDGPAASGKSTVARRVAEALGAVVLNTGAMYRIVGRQALIRRIDPVAAPEEVADMLDELDLQFRHARTGPGLDFVLNGDLVPESHIRNPETALAASRVAGIPAVRTWLVARQREAAALGLLVAEGRDIGTVVFPEARFKFFLTATPEVRARRRLAQQGESPSDATVEHVAAEIAERDRLDRTRRISPLRPAPDAISLDTSDLNLDDVVTAILRIIQRGSCKTPRGRA